VCVCHIYTHILHFTLNIKVFLLHTSLWYSRRLCDTSQKFAFPHVTYCNFSNLHLHTWLTIIPEICTHTCNSMWFSRTSTLTCNTFLSHATTYYSHMQHITLTCNSSPWYYLMHCMWEWDYKCLFGTKIWTLTCNTLRFLKFALTIVVHSDCSNYKCLVGTPFVSSWHHRNLHSHMWLITIPQIYTHTCDSFWFLRFTLTRVTHSDSSDLYSHTWLILILQTTSRWYSLHLFLTSLKFTLTQVTHYDSSDLHSHMWLTTISQIYTYTCNSFWFLIFTLTHVTHSDSSNYKCLFDTPFVSSWHHLN